MDDVDRSLFFPFFVLSLQLLLIHHMTRRQHLNDICGFLKTLNQQLKIEDRIDYFLEAFQVSVMFRDCQSFHVFAVPGELLSIISCHFQFRFHSTSFI